MIKYIPDNVDSSGSHWKYLIVTFYFEPQTDPEILPNLSQKRMKKLLTGREDNYIVGIPEVFQATSILLYEAVHACEIEISEELAQIISDRKSFGAVNDLVKKPKKAIVLELPTKKIFENMMIDGRIKFPDIQLQTKLSAKFIFEGFFDGIGGPMYALSLYTRISISREISQENGLQDKHYGPMDNPVREIWKTMYLPFLRFKDREDGVGGSAIRLIAEHHMKALQVAFAVQIMSLDARLMAFALSGTTVSLPEILQVYDSIV